MNLRQMILEVRRAIDEPTPDFWTDDELTDWLNEGAKLMASECQPLQAYYQFTVTGGQAEYPLPPDFDEVFGVSYFTSYLYPLSQTNPQTALWGNLTTGLPDKFYLRAITNQTAPQGTGGNLAVAPLYPGDPSHYSYVLGLVACPAASTDKVTVLYFPKHFNMTAPSDVSPIPLEFHRGMVHYATAIAKQKDEAYSEMNDIYLPLFEKFKDRLKQKMINRGSELGFPKLNVTGEDQWDTNTSIIVIPNQVS